MYTSEDFVLNNFIKTKAYLLSRMRCVLYMYVYCMYTFMYIVMQTQLVLCWDFPLYWFHSVYFGNCNGNRYISVISLEPLCIAPGNEPNSPTSTNRWPVYLGDLGPNEASRDNPRGIRAMPRQRGKSLRPGAMPGQCGGGPRAVCRGLGDDSSHAIAGSTDRGNKP